MDMEVRIQNKETIYLPCVSGEIVWELERKGTPGKITFNVVKDNVINFQEGNAVALIADGNPIFYGYVFTKKRDKGNTITVTAYDQIRYLKNKETINETDLSVTGLVSLIAADFGIVCGTLEDTGVVLPLISGDNQTLLDTIQEAIGETLDQSGELYVLYDDVGKLTLKNINSMKLDLVVDEENAENFDYETSIDHETYTRVRIIYDDEQKGADVEELPKDAKDDTKIKNWGVLQYFDKAESEAEAVNKAAQIYKLYGNKTRKLSVKNVLGDVRVRGGSAVGVILNLGDIITMHYMMVEKVKHYFRSDEHVMDLTLVGGEFIV